MRDEKKKAVFEGRSPRRGLLLAASLAVIATAYSNATAGPFVWDDRELILRDPVVQGQAPMRELLLHPFWRKSASVDREQPSGGYYRPLTAASYVLDWKLSGGSSGWFHLVNVGLHLTVCALVFLLVARGGGSGVAAALAATLFGLSPRLTESVTWISGRTDLLAASFTLVALWAHAPGASRRRRVLAAVALLMGLLCKEVAVAGVAALAALELTLARREGMRWGLALRRAGARWVPVALAVTVYAALRVYALGGSAPGALREIALSPGARAVLVLQALGTYGMMLLDPLRPRLLIGVLGRIEVAPVLAGIGVLALSVACARRAWRKRWAPESIAASTLACVALALVLHLLPLRVVTVAADRFLYFPLMGAAIGLGRAAAGLAAPWGRRWAWAALACLPCFGTALYWRNWDWSNELRLWQVAVATAPKGEDLPENELANVLFRARRYEEARVHYQRVLEGRTGRYRLPVLGNLASTASESGDYDRARSLTLELIAREPTLPLHRYNLGIIEARRLDLDAAERSLAEALALLPVYPEASAALERVRSIRGALAALPPSAREEPSDIRLKRASIDLQLGRWREAREALRRLAEADDLSGAQRVEVAANAGAVEDFAVMEVALGRARAQGGAEVQIERLEARLQAWKSGRANAGR